MKPYGYWLMFVGALLLSPPAWAQHAVPHDVFGCGGGSSTDGSNYLYDTVGQRLIGVVSDAANRQKMGYYYVVDQLHIGPTSEVLISEFLVEFSEWGVNLQWEITSADDLKGFNVYRSLTLDDPFKPINTVLIPVEGGNSYRDERVKPGTTYWYKLGAVDRDGEFLSVPVSVNIPPAKLTLYQNHPNPFNPTTTISFFLPGPSRVELVIFDVEGRQIKKLVNEKRDFGKHQVIWNGRNDRGEHVSSGVYFYRLKTGKTVLTRKLTLLK